MTVLDPRATPLAISLLGPFSFLVNGAPLPRLRSHRLESILALLTLRHERPVDRTWLAGLLWPDSSESRGLATLRRYLTELRQALGPEARRLHSPSSSSLAFDLQDATVDLIAFEACVRRGDPQSLAEAVALYRGPLLEEWTEEWVFQERQAREQEFLAALVTLAAAARDRGDLEASAAHLRRAVCVDPLRESAQRELMQVLAAGGNYAAALQVYRELRLLLHRQMNTEPDAETTGLFQQLRAEARRRAQAPCRFPLSAPANSSGPKAAEPAHLLPEGTVTFLLTDIEGSTKLWLKDPEGMRQALARHDALAAAIVRQHDGFLLKQRGEGDSLFAVFARATDAVAAALAYQRALGDCGAQEARGIVDRELSDKGKDGPALDVAADPQSAIRLPPLKIRIALHTGEAELREGDYFGLAVNHCARLRAMAHGGQVLLSGATRELVSQALPERAGLRDLGSHRIRDIVEPERVFQLLHPELPTQFPPLISAVAASNNLPLSLTSFVGRERETEEVRRLLATTRLLTLTGPGGCGKTRLALHAATQVLHEFLDGVWLVELAPLADPALVAQTVVSVLGARTAPSAMNALEDARRPALTLLKEYLRQKKLLLILDNCEHLTDECARLVETLLRACPNLRILATSRETLGAAGETAWRVPSLSLPDLKGELLPAVLAQYEAIRLFVDRATAALPSFQVTEKNAPALARVCHQLDGIPLAIELAAVRVKALPVEQLAARLDDQFRLLTGGSRTALPRQQTLRATIDWSYDLLTEAERALLRRLAVFAGGWSLEFAEAICAGEGGEEGEILDLLTQLVAKSLVQYEEHDGEGRYRLLEIIRQYSRARLLETVEAVSLRRRHRDLFLALAEQAEPELQRARQVAWLKRLDLEQDNLRAALAWCLADDEGVETGLRLAAALPRYWALRGAFEEGVDWLKRVLARGGGSPAVRAKALCQAGSTPWWAQDIAGAQTFLEEGQALYQELGDQAGIAMSLLGLGQVAERHGDLELARSHLEASRAIAEQLTDEAGVADSLLSLGRVAWRRDDYATARGHFERSLALYRRAGDIYGACLSLQGLGHLAWRQGDLVAARAHYTASLATMRELENRSAIPWSLTMLANVARCEGDLSSARSLFEESASIHQYFGRRGDAAWCQLGAGNVALAQGDQAAARSLYTEVLKAFREHDDREGSAFALERFASLAAATGQSETVARLLGAAEALREAIEFPLPPVDRTEYYDRLVEETRIALGEKRFAAAWAEGRAISLEEAIQFALDPSPHACE
jgi:predicted ATPase/DNA-binding SARP family transcriptional activator